MTFAEILQPHDIVIGLRAPDIAAAARSLLEKTLPFHALPSEEVERLIAAVEAREHELSTVCGPIAIPHTRDSRIRKFIGAVGVNHDGIVDGQPVPRVIFVFISPEAERASHLELLASLARLSRNAPEIDAIGNAATAADVIALLK